MRIKSTILTEVKTCVTSLHISCGRRFKIKSWESNLSCHALLFGIISIRAVTQLYKNGSLWTKMIQTCVICTKITPIRVFHDKVKFTFSAWIYINLKVATSESWTHNTGLGVRCLSFWANQTCVIWQTHNWNIFHASFHFWTWIFSRIIRTCLMQILA